jgi:hypothetical protein
MSIPSPLQQYHFHVILIWWHSPFNVSQVQNLVNQMLFECAHAEPNLSISGHAQFMKKHTFF